MELLSEREVFEDQFLMPTIGQGQRSRDQHNYSHYALDRVVGGARIQPAQAPDSILARHKQCLRLVARHDRFSVIGLQSLNRRAAELTNQEMTEGSFLCCERPVPPLIYGEPEQAPTGARGPVPPAEE